MIELKDVCKTYFGKGVETIALRDINLQIEAGEFVAITGKSGCGKSTLLNIIGRMDDPTSGEYYFQSTDMRTVRGKNVAVFRNQNIGYVFQSFCLISEMNALDNVSVPLGYRGLGARERKERAKQALARVGLADRMKHYPSQLSGGQQRVAIARALANDPAIILADEPTGNLDTATSEQILELFQEINEKGKTTLMITHNLDLASRAGRQIHLEDGRVAGSR